MTVFALFAAALTAGPAQAVFTAPIAQAASGLEQCYSPDRARRSCASMAIFSRSPDGVIDNTATVMLAAKPLVLMSTVSTVTAKQGRLCSVMHQSDIAAARFTIDGEPAGVDHSAELEAAVAKAFAPIIEHEVCIVFEPDGSEFVAHTSLDGLPRPGLDQRVLWVPPAEDWQVRPPD